MGASTGGELQVPGPAERASSRGAAQARHGRAQPPRGELASPRGQVDRRRADPAAARASALKARGLQGKSDAAGAVPV